MPQKKSIKGVASPSEEFLSQNVSSAPPEVSFAHSKVSSSPAKVPCPLRSVKWLPLTCPVLLLAISCTSVGVMVRLVKVSIIASPEVPLLLLMYPGLSCCNVQGKFIKMKEEQGTTTLLFRKVYRTGRNSCYLCY